MALVKFPGRQQPGGDLPDPLRRELEAIDRWLAAASGSLRDRAYAEVGDHGALISIARRMKAALLTEWHEAQPRDRR